MAVRDSLQRGPSGSAQPICKCGVSLSIANRRAMPAIKPTAAGTTAMRPMPAHISIPGMSSDHTEAATITPEAKPNNDFCANTGMPLFMKNTKAEPKTVPRNGISNVSNIYSFILVCLHPQSY